MSGLDLRSAGFLVGLGLALALMVLLIAMLGLAIRRSRIRQECARWRDLLVDGVRLGELDLGDWRLYQMIDWFDQVAGHGRVTAVGRHACTGDAPPDRLAFSLAAALGPAGFERLAATEIVAGSPGVAGSGFELRVEAVAYRERLLHRTRYLRQLRVRAVDLPNQGAVVTGHGRPEGALVLMATSDGDTGALDLRDLRGLRDLRELRDLGDQSDLPDLPDLRDLPERTGAAGPGARSLTEEIFAVADPAR